MLAGTAPPRCSGQKVTRLLAVAEVTCVLMIALHFACELVDKLQRFDYWSEQIKQMGFEPSGALLGFIVFLLILGVTSLTLAPLVSIGNCRKRTLSVAVASLLMFQIPTSVLSERGTYEITSSVAVMGGLLLYYLGVVAPKPTE